MSSPSLRRKKVTEIKASNSHDPINSQHLVFSTTPLFSSSYDPSSDQIQEVRNNLQYLLNDSIDTDVTVKCIGAEFKVHKFVLFMSSGYFMRTLRNALQTSELDFSTIKKDTMKVIIDFMYLSRTNLPNDENSVMELYEAAQLLEIKPLIKYYGRKIVDNLNADNYFRVWRMNEKYSDEKIQKGFGKFILGNLQSVMKNASFLELTHSDLEFIIEKINQSNIKAKDYMMQSILEWAKYESSREEMFGKFCTSFKEFDLSWDYVDFLVNNEPLVNKNAELLLYLLKTEMQKTRNYELKDKEKIPLANPFQAVTPTTETKVPTSESPAVTTATTTPEIPTFGFSFCASRK